MSVFTGPVFAGNDPVYRGIALPKQFWKVAVMVREDGNLSATAYLLSQASLLKNIEEEEFLYSAYKTFQVPVARVEAMTKLDFGELRRFDPLKDATEAAGVREIQFLQQIQF